MRGDCARGTALLKTVEISEIAATVAEKKAKIYFFDLDNDLHGDPRSNLMTSFDSQSGCSYRSPIVTICLSIAVPELFRLFVFKKCVIRFIIILLMNIHYGQ